mmetsp:Transcript_146776/g.259390  ORF Transcript_146776/g.259390 Transcript_146776/m.259390 type:complete len:96 (+) Transcript_146776:514-801(+)
MRPLGAKFCTSATFSKHERISQYTPASRMRRQIKWLTCEPKSTTSIRSCCPQPAIAPTAVVIDVFCAAGAVDSGILPRKLRTRSQQSHYCNFCSA